jgi:hypothetical protein
MLQRRVGGTLDRPKWDNRGALRAEFNVFWRIADCIAPAIAALRQVWSTFLTNLLARARYK